MTGDREDRPSRVPARQVVGAVVASTISAAGLFVERLVGLGPGAFLAALAPVAPVIIRAFVASAVSRVTPGERQRSDLAIYTAGTAAIEYTEAGGRPNEQVFTPHDETGWTAADDLADSVIRAAASDGDRRKAGYLGRLWASLVFQSDLSLETMFHFVSLADELSYSQLQLLALFADRDAYELPTTRPTDMTWDSWGIWQAFDDLGYAKRELLGPEAAPPGQMPTWIGVPSRTKINSTGMILVELMDLDRIPADELALAAERLSA